MAITPAFRAPSAPDAGLIGWRAGGEQKARKKIKWTEKIIVKEAAHTRN